MARLITALLLWLLAWPAAADVVVTFYGKDGNLSLTRFVSPHAYVVLEGRLDSGEPVLRMVSFGAADGGGIEQLMRAGPGVLTDYAGSEPPVGKAYLSIRISDATFYDLTKRMDWWATPAGNSYNVHNRNCVGFVADVAQRLGLRTPSDDTWSPNGFLEQMVAMNPPGSVPGLLPGPVPFQGFATDPVAPAVSSTAPTM
ncbi:MAG: hypothetical protein KJ676_08845 [Alphaproteobacteria bacterium]|nr:hypothetical protein [Alphaproteobacteria bacterium]MBU1525454.1 hypothetical protein [Alphaproteobacteria bacterium]MBU2118428.1 hypothetical protein [Alphaproteobacteria bacterium]MBU2350856.1 hypothetical protein [Alphaproteobacteria bacterium]MBU2381763.1 hypothetical protein [Alphaproteobacteria bacterium]